MTAPSIIGARRVSVGQRLYYRGVTGGVTAVVQHGDGTAVVTFRDGRVVTGGVFRLVTPAAGDDFRDVGLA